MTGSRRIIERPIFPFKTMPPDETPIVIRPVIAALDSVSGVCILDDAGRALKRDADLRWCEMRGLIPPPPGSAAGGISIR